MTHRAPIVTALTGVRARPWGRILSALALVLLAIGQGALPRAGQGGAGTGSAEGAAAVVPAARQAKNVAVITIHREIDAVMARSVGRRMELAEQSGANAIVFDLDTPGGELGAVLEICNLIKRSPIPNTVAWINPDAYSGGAIIALACREIVVADYATMGDAAIIATDILGQLNQLKETERQKFLGPLLAEVVDSARRRGYDERLVQGFVSRGVDLWLVEHAQTGRRLFIGRDEYRTLFGREPDGGSPTLTAASGGEPFTLDEGPAEGDGEPIGPPAPAGAGSGDFVPAVPGLSQQVVDEVALGQELGSRRPVLTAADRDDWRLVEFVADGNGIVTLKTTELLRYALAAETVKNDEELRTFFGATNLVRIDESWSESMVAFLSHPIVKGVLIVLLLLGVFLEMTHPGLILPGTVAAVALVTLLAPAFLNNMAAWWEIAAIVLGILFLGAEVFVLPGFGFFGVLGVLCLFGGLLGTFIPNNGHLFPDSPGARQDLLYGVLTIALSGVTAGVLMYVVSKHLGTLPVFGRLVLQDTAPDDETDQGLLAAMEPADGEVRPGMVGIALTPLRPAGRIQIGDRIIDVVSDLGFVPPGAEVRVIRSDAFRIAVEPVHRAATPGTATSPGASGDGGVAAGTGA